MSGLQEYKCPACGGYLEFNSERQKLKCPYCESEFDADYFASVENQSDELPPDEMKWENSAGGEWEDGEGEHLVSYICDSCGGEIICDDTTAASRCPYCDNPVVMTGNFSGNLKPDLVIPFRLNKDDAKKALTEHYKGKILLPKVFKDKNHIDEITGVYVPFWLFDAQCDADVVYNATRLSSWSDSDYRYTKTSIYRVYRGGGISFAAVPADGSSKMPDDLMESVEPFDVTEAVDFRSAYLAGYLADRYDIDASQSIERVNDRIRQSVVNEFSSTVMGYSSVIPERTSVRLHNSGAKYALYPVWFLNTTYNGEKYTFAMNGQTGKMVGDMPVDKGMFAKLFALIWAGVSILSFAVSFFLWL